MIKRYLIASFLIIVIAGGAAGLAYKAKSKLTYNASCTVEVFVRAPALNAGTPNPDFLTFTNNLAANEVQLATPTVLGDIAKSQKLTVGEVASKVQILPAIGIGAFRVSATDSDPKRTKSLASAGCSTYVSTIVKQRAHELDSDLKAIQKRIDSLEKDVARLSKAKASARNTISLATAQEALRTNSQLVVQYKTLPPDNITVLTPATGVVSMRSVSLKKYAAIAAVAALLVIFLYILLVEALSPQRKDATAA